MYTTRAYTCSAVSIQRQPACIGSGNRRSSSGRMLLIGGQLLGQAYRGTAQLPVTAPSVETEALRDTVLSLAEPLRAANEGRRASEVASSSPPAPPTAPLPCPCIEAFPASLNLSSEEPVIVDISGTAYEYPNGYGLNCSAHDAGLRPFCSVTIDGDFSPLDNPRWCSRAWCWVNASDCQVTFTPSQYIGGEGLYYSYQT